MLMKILCLGKTPDLLKTRCAVLAHNGYNAHAATIPEGFHGLRPDRYDLVIVSARLVEEYGRLLPSEVPAIVLDGMVFPDELLSAVTEKIKHASGCGAAMSHGQKHSLL